MAGAVSICSTLPPQCGHFFKCGPLRFSIFSVRRWHFTHSYSYSGTVTPPHEVTKERVYHAKQRLPSAVLNSIQAPLMTETSHQNSSPEQRTGHLYLVATPIGNLEDITLRALRILREADQIACEDTRHTLKLLNHFEIHKPLVSYHEHNEMTRAPELVLAMEQGAQIALVRDAENADARLSISASKIALSFFTKRRTASLNPSPTLSKFSATAPLAWRA